MQPIQSPPSTSRPSPSNRPPVNERLARVDAERCSRSLRLFIRRAWHVPEPATRFVPGWHIDAIAEHLEAVARGEIRNLLINIPPRFSKSLQVAVFWPAWVWTWKPAMRWLFSTYADRLTIRDSLRCRRLIESPWYQARWGAKFELTGDQNQKSRFENSATGYRIATSVGGTATGEGGDCIVVDDPHKADEALSEVKRESVLTWWDETMSTRLNDPSTGAKVVVMQRLHEADLTGHLLEMGGYEHLCLPMEYEVDRRCVTGIGWEDPRTDEGDLLWPERVPRETVEELKLAMGSMAVAGQLQQRPAPRGGGLFKADRLGVVTSLPDDVVRRVRYWDKAASEGEGDYTVGALVAQLVDGRYAIEDIRRGRWSVAEREEIIRQAAQIDGLEVEIGIEQEPGSGGKESAEATVRRLAGFRSFVDKPTGAKELRAEPLAVQIEARNVVMMQGEWNHPLLDEMRVFPAGAHDDQVDACAGAFNRLASGPPPLRLL